MVKQKKRRGRPKAEVPRSPFFSLQGSDEFAQWLRDLAEHCGLPMTITVVESLREYAEKRKFRPPPKR